MNVPDPGVAARRRASAVLAAGLLLLSALGGFLAYRLIQAPRPTLYPVSARTGRAQPAPPAAAPEVRRKIPEGLPQIALPAPDGTLHRLSDYRGHLLAVNFWATWCEPCRREMPLLQSLRREHAKDGVEIVGIAIDQRPEVAKYTAAHGIDYPILVGEKGGLEAANALGMDVVLPFTVFADRAGRIVTVKVGELHGDEAGLILERMTDLDRGSLTLEEARQAIASGVRRLNASRTSPGPGSGH